MIRVLATLIASSLIASSLVASIVPATPLLADDEPRRPGWVRRSNEHARILLEVVTRFDPEQAAELGIKGIDSRVVDQGLARRERYRAALAASIEALESRLDAEKDVRVRHDLELLIRSTRQELAEKEAADRYLLPWVDVAQHVYSGVRSLLDPQVEPERRAAAATRLRRYAGLEDGYTPLATLAEARVRERLDTLGLLFPMRAQLEQQLANSDRYLEGIRKLLEEYDIRGAGKSVKVLGEQIAAWNAFVRQEILPKARDDYRLPPELYVTRLRGFGVEMPPDVLAERARISYMEIRNEMQTLAPLVARQAGLDRDGLDPDGLEGDVLDYRTVLAALKTKQVGDDAVIALYQDRLASIERIVEREGIVSLPERPARIRLASGAESAQSPAPHMDPPPFVGNRGEQGEFVLPVSLAPVPGSTGAERFDDFSYEAATWTMTAHEARPGHELQFASMVENGTSLARAVIAFNSANVEGWALYAEAEIKPYLPLDGQLVALQFRLLRAARAFLDPGLQSGDITEDDARRILSDEVGLSPAMVRQELERYTFRMPGQATSYFYGYQRLLDLRARAEVELGDRFNRRRFHDFIIAQGILPADLLTEVVTTEFIPSERARR